jgi:hypothetical protein
MTSAETLPPTIAVNKFLYTISTDQYGKIGSNYVEHNEALEYILSISPEEFETMYNNYKTQTQYISNNPVKDDLNKKKDEMFFWLEGNRENTLRYIKEIYEELKEKRNIYDNEQKKYVPDNRPLPFRFALMLWLYIYH